MSERDVNGSARSFTSERLHRFDGRRLSRGDHRRRSARDRHRDAHVIYVGTFSKTVFPSLRLGFCVVPDSLVEAVTNARAVADRQSPMIDQAVLTEFMASGQSYRKLSRV